MTAVPASRAHPGPSAGDTPSLGLLLEAERAATLARLRTLRIEFDGVVLDALDANLDDEHDPEGPTLSLIHIFDGDDLRSAGVVHEGVDPPPPLQGGAHQAGRPVVLGDVSPDVERVGKRRRQCLAGLDRVGGVDQHRGATLGELPGNRSADARRGPSDEGDMAFERARAHRGRIPQAAVHSCPGSSTTRSRPERNASGGQVIGSMASPCRRRSTAPIVSPV